MVGDILLGANQVRASGALGAYWMECSPRVSMAPRHCIWMNFLLARSLDLGRLHAPWNSQSIKPWVDPKLRSLSPFLSPAALFKISHSTNRLWSPNSLCFPPNSHSLLLSSYLVVELLWGKRAQMLGRPKQSARTSRYAIPYANFRYCMDNYRWNSLHFQDNPDPATCCLPPPTTYCYLYACDEDEDCAEYQDCGGCIASTKTCASGGSWRSCKMSSFATRMTVWEAR